MKFLINLIKKHILNSFNIKVNLIKNLSGLFRELETTPTSNEWVVSLGKRNPGATYTIEGHKIRSTH